MQKSKKQNHIMCPLRGLVQHRPKNPPNLGRMGCLCQLLSPKGHMIWFLFFHYTFPVAKWVRKYPPCALHKTFLVRCLRKYSVSDNITKVVENDSNNQFLPNNENTKALFWNLYLEGTARLISRFNCLWCMKNIGIQVGWNKMNKIHKYSEL